ncbi:MAG TPA: rhodanese-like domain-containing protein [Planctomycetota bacterium]|nr:rhodanese-like domain-containing protein [Planctomycetota bacterium]
MTFESLTPAQLRDRLRVEEDLVVLDVREDEERALCAIEGSLHIPMGELSVRHVELDPERPTVCVCHHGIRSAHVTAALARLGFERLYNLTGGIDRWAAEVEPDMARY